MENLWTGPLVFLCLLLLLVAFLAVGILISVLLDRVRERTALFAALPQDLPGFFGGTGSGATT